MSIYNDLLHKGFCVVENLVDNSLLELLNNDFNLIKNFPVSKHYPVLPVGKKLPVTDLLNKVIDPLSESIKNNTGISTNVHPTPVYFSIKHGVNFDWHQDHESFYQTGDHSNYLNIYIPIYKTDPALSNVCVINFEKLLDLDPSLAFLKGYGATRFSCKDNKTIIKDDNTDKETVLNFNINQIADCPNLKVGDALIMRGDCIHRTQDTLTDRVSISIRRMDCNTIINKSNFDINSQVKEFIFKNSEDYYQKLISKFSNNDEIKLGDLLDLHTR